MRHIRPAGIAGLRDGGTIRDDDPALVAGRQARRDAVPLPPGADPQTPRLSASEGDILILAHRRGGEVTTGHAATIFDAGGARNYDEAAKLARATLDGLAGNGLLARAPEHEDVFRLTNPAGRGLARALAEQQDRANISADEVTALAAAHRANGGATVGHVAMLLAGPVGWTSSAADKAKSALDRLAQRGLVSQHPKRAHVFLLTTSGRGLAALLADQQARSCAPQSDGGNDATET